MLTIKCNKCNGSLLIDEQATSTMYLREDPHYLVNIDTGKLEEGSIQDYLVYVCNVCGNTCKFTYKEWEAKYRMEIANQVMEIRKRAVFKNINPETVKIDNGLDFCGQCSGYAGDGYCLIDIINQCMIRNR